MLVITGVIASSSHAASHEQVTSVGGEGESTGTGDAGTTTSGTPGASGAPQASTPSQSANTASGGS